MGRLVVLFFAIIMVALIVFRLFGPEEVRIGDTVILQFDEMVKDVKGGGAQ